MTGAMASLATVGLDHSVIAPRFWALVRIGSPDECWCWTGFVSRKGYGRFNVGGKVHGGWRKLPVHRIAYELTYGPPRPGLFILHSCDNPSCCNPAHLRPGTHLENMAEMRAKGRRIGKSAKGEAVKVAKLTENDVRDMRSRHPRESIAALARDFGVAETTAAYAIKRKNWAHVQ